MIGRQIENVWKPLKSGVIKYLHFVAQDLLPEGAFYDIICKNHTYGKFSDIAFVEATKPLPGPGIIKPTGEKVISRHKTRANRHKITAEERRYLLRSMIIGFGLLELHLKSDSLLHYL